MIILFLVKIQHLHLISIHDFGLVCLQTEQVQTQSGTKCQDCNCEAKNPSFRSSLIAVARMFIIIIIIAIVTIVACILGCGMSSEISGIIAIITDIDIVVATQDDEVTSIVIDISEIISQNQDSHIALLLHSHFEFLCAVVF